AQTYPTGGYASSAVLGDFTGDGKTDVAATSNSSNQVSVLYGQGGGTLSNPVQFATGSNPWALAAGDFNGDGRPDVATADNGGGAVSVLINDQFWPPPPPPPPPSVGIGDVTVTEGNTGTTTATFTVTLSAAYDAAVTVHWATADGTAAAGSDYTAGSGDVTFAAGQTSKTITVAVLGDRVSESTETFVVNLSGATNAGIADAQ